MTTQPVPDMAESASALVDGQLPAAAAGPVVLAFITDVWRLNGGVIT